MSSRDLGEDVTITLSVTNRDKSNQFITPCRFLTGLNMPLCS